VYLIGESMKNIRGEKAVTEIVGTILLLGMAITVFAVIYSNVLSDDGPGPEALVTIVGKIEGDDILIEHCSGESLGLDTKVFLTFGPSPPDSWTVEQLLTDEYKQDGWNIGEQLIFNYPEGYLNNVPILATVVDKKSNSLVFWGILQEGAIVPRGGIWHFDEEYYKYSGTEKDVLDSSGNKNHGIARGGARHVLADPDPKVYPDLPSNPPGDNNPDNVVSGIGSCYFNGIEGSDVLVENHYSLDIKDEITLEAWMKPLNYGYIRSISDFNAKFSYYPDWIHVDGNIYAIVGEGKGVGPGNPSQQGLISTVIIKPNGAIEEIEINDEIQVFEFDRPAFKPDIIKVWEDEDFNYYAIVYSGENPYDGFIKIVKISKDNGAIDIMEEIPKNSFDKPVTNPRIINVANDIYAITYTGKNNAGNDAGFLITIKIDPADWSITIKKSQELSYPAYLPRIIRAENDLFVVVYSDESNEDQLGNGYIQTFNIDPTSDTTITPKYTTLLDKKCNEPTIIQISNQNQIYGIVYKGLGFAGYINTIEVNIDNLDPLYGEISKIYADPIKFDSQSYSPDIIHISGENYAIVYTDKGGKPDGKISILEITSTGSIDPNKIELLISDFYNPMDETTYPCFTPKFIPITDEIFAVVFRSSSVAPPHQGLICTFRLGENPTPPFSRGVFKSGSISIYADNEDIYASLITEDEVEHDIQLGYTDLLTDKWYHIALTFDGTTITLYCGIDENGDGQIETIDSKSLDPFSEPKKIKSSDKPLKFGYLFFGYLDEIAIKEEALTQQEIFS